MELVVVRDGGEQLQDAARDALVKLEFPAIVIEREDPPEGLARSRNRGVVAARADAVAFLDDDDLWEPQHVAQLAGALDRGSEVSVVYSDAAIWQEATDTTRFLAVDFDLGTFGRDSFIPPSAVGARKSGFERFGLFDPEMRYSEDWDWLLRVARGGGTIARIPGVTGMSQLSPERLAERRHALELLSRRHGLGPLEPKTFWEVAGDLCQGRSASTR
jgi:glycosyltransferase involved in cell wall biosynthesis